MARATTTAPSSHHRPPSAIAAAAAATAKAKAAATPPTASAASLVPQRRATATTTARSTFSRSPHHHPHPHHRRVTPPVVVVAPGLVPKQRASCACSPTTHPGSYRCALHRGSHQVQASAGGAGSPLPVVPAALAAAAPVSSRLSAPRRASMANPLVRIAAVEGGDHIRRVLAALVRPPPSQTPRRRGDNSFFRPTPSRLSVMSSASAS